METFEAAVIAPGIRTSAQAMWNQAAMLPAVEIKKPEINFSKRDHFLYAGRNCIRTDWADRVYRQEIKEESRICRCKSCSKRRSR